MANALLSIRQLELAFQDHKVVDGISFDIFAGETFALVGESGSGKSLTALAVMRLLPVAATMKAAAIDLAGVNLLKLPELEVCRIRGRRLGFIFQDPMSSLNPVMTIGAQIAEVLTIHFQLTPSEVKQRVLALLEQVEIPDPERRVNVYPHQLSGGQRQRVMIAIALAAKPDILIADEPTTALDVTIQAQILALLKSIQQQTGMALWLISHDLALVSNIADRIAVMQRGKIVETATAASFFQQPQHPYSLKLLAALPNMQSCQNKPLQSQADLLKVNDFKVYYPIRTGLFQRVVGHVKAVDGVSLVLPQASTLALVGESGCGKTSLAKALVNLLPAHGGSMCLNGVDLTQLSGEALRLKRAEIQIIFQDPFAAMNPRMLVGDIIAEGLKALHPEISQAQRQQQVADLLIQVDLPEQAALRYPHEFSGGQRQRICIARALAVKPKLIICDEPTSALDVSVQAQIIDLLKKLQQQQGLSYLLITHNLGVVAEMADQVAVMFAGKIVEQGPVEQVLMRPQHDYTKELIEALPRLKSV